MKKIFITGTGTGVGKTVSSGLLAKLLTKNFRVGYMKPIQTGSDDDVKTVNDMCDDLIKLPPYLQMPYHFSLAASPHLACRQEGKTIKIDKILQIIDDIENDYSLDYLIIEGVGGILVPLAENYYTIDLLESIGCPCLVVGHCQLGTLNHSLLTHQVLENRGLTCLGLILSSVPQKKDIIIQENINFLSQTFKNVIEINYCDPTLSSDECKKLKKIIG